jgi:hypothetical protein
VASGRAFVLRHGLPGLAGTALVAIGALGIGWLPLETNLLANPLVEALRGSLTGSLVARGFVFIGLAVLLQAWLVLGAELRVAHRTRDVLGVLILWSIPLLVAPPMFSRDVYSYYVQGRLLDSGIDPTTSGVASVSGWFQDGADPMWAEAPTPYGPLFLMIERAVASFAHPNAYLASILFRLVAIIGVVLLAIYVPRLARSLGVNEGRALWLGVLNPLILMHFISGAHNDALMVGLLVAGLSLAVCNRCVWGGVLVAGAVCVKPIALLALPFVGLLWAGVNSTWIARIKAWAITALVAGITIVCVYLVADAGYGVISAAFGTPSGVLTWLSPSTAIGQIIGYATTWLGLTSDGMSAVTVMRAIASLAALVIVAWLILRPGRRNPVRGAALALATVVVLGPVIQPWYLLWFLPLFAASGLGDRGTQIAVLATAAFTVHAMVESSATSDNFLDVTDGITFLLAVVITAVILLASPRERRLVLGSEPA